MLTHLYIQIASIVYSHQYSHEKADNTLYNIKPENAIFKGGILRTFAINTDGSNFPLTKPISFTVLNTEKAAIAVPKPNLFFLGGGGVGVYSKSLYTPSRGGVKWDENTVSL